MTAGSDDIPEASPAAARFAALAAAFSDKPGVTYGGANAPRKRFGADALKVDGKIFAMLVRGELVVKLPRTRVAALIESGHGAPFDTGASRIMREWITLPADGAADWRALTAEALGFVGPPA